MVGFPPKSSILIGFSIIFTIHFGGFPTILGGFPHFLVFFCLLGQKRQVFLDKNSYQAYRDRVKTQDLLVEGSIPTPKTPWTLADWGFSWKTLSIIGVSVGLKEVICFFHQTRI